MCHLEWAAVRRLVRSATGLAFAAAPSACDVGGGSAPAPPPDEVFVTAGSSAEAQLQIGGSLTVRALAYRGGTLTGGTARDWAVSDSTVARLAPGPDGYANERILQTLRVGSVTVSATIAGLRGTTTAVRVLPRLTLDARPDSLTLAVGDSVPLRAVVADLAGEPVAHAVVTWGVRFFDPTGPTPAVVTPVFARADSAAQVLGYRPGLAVVTAELAGARDTILVTVTPRRVP